MLPDFYIPSRSAGKHWRVQLHQPAGHKAHIGAIEGRLTDGQFYCDPGVPRSTTFYQVHHGNIGAILEKLLLYMACQSYITREQAQKHLAWRLTPSTVHRLVDHE